MNSITRERLEAINRNFYSVRADAFDASRDHPWPGWQRSMGRIASGENGASAKVLDVGCGNGRLAHYLLDQFAQEPERLEYVGIDQSAPLLSAARARIPQDHGARLRWVEADILEERIDSALPAGPFDLVAAFGLLHHVPGFEHRKALLAALAQRTRILGRLVFTAWRFANAERFENRITPWESHNADSPDPIDLQHLEAGDFLLSFGTGPGPPRYCHHCDDFEFDKLVAATGLELVDDFEADGRSGDLNRYAVLRRAG